MKVAILGAGAYGTALGGVLANKGYDIDYYDPKLEKERLSDALDGSNAIILCVPSENAIRLLPHLPKNLFMIVATKGFLTGKPFAEFTDWAVLSGAGYADDIKNSRPVVLTATDNRIFRMFKTDYLDIELSADVEGVLLCGALKNVYAIGAGLRNLKPGTKFHTEYLCMATDEMRAILFANGANPDTVELSCGVSDLRLTCDYPSRNYEYGRKLSQNADYKSDDTVEGLATLSRIRNNAIVIPENLKILEGILDATQC